jgi:hypothetical protein
MTLGCNADEIFIQGEFWLTAQGKTKHLQPGDSFQVLTLVNHKKNIAFKDAFLRSRESDSQIF